VCVCVCACVCVCTCGCDSWTRTARPVGNLPQGRREQARRVDGVRRRGAHPRRRSAGCGARRRCRSRETRLQWAGGAPWRFNACNAVGSTSRSTCKICSKGRFLCCMLCQRSILVLHAVPTVDFGVACCANGLAAGLMPCFVSAATGSTVAHSSPCGVHTNTHAHAHALKHTHTHTQNAVEGKHSRMCVCARARVVPARERVREYV